MTEPFARFFDDAALFPPGDAPVAAAVPAHRELRGRLGDLVGPFVVPAARLDELAVMVDTFRPLELGEGGTAVDDGAYAWSWAGRGPA